MSKRIKARLAYVVDDVRCEVFLVEPQESEIQR